MSLFHTGFSVDAAVPVASTSTTAHAAAGSVHKKRKRSNDEGSNNNSNTDKSKDSAENASLVNASSGAPAASSLKNATNSNGNASILADVDSKSASQSTETVVNIEKLMKKLQRMEKGGKADDDSSSSSAKNKKQKTQAVSSNGRNNDKNATPARGSNSIATTKNDKGKAKDQDEGVTTPADGSNKAKKAKNKKNKKDGGEAKPEYVPDAEALAKREARQKKRESRAATSIASASASAPEKIVLPSGETAPDTATSEVPAEGEGEGDASTMDIDTLEQVVQQPPATLEPTTSETTAVAVVPSPTKKQKKAKKNVQPDIQVEVEAANSISKTAPAISTPAAKSADSGMTDLQKRMQKKLGGARFRWINEQLYTTSGIDALQLMEEDPAMFEDYHNGFASQATSWPAQPIHLFIDHFKRTYSKPTSSTKPVIADLGCGKAELARTLVPLGFTVLSYDLVEEEPYIIKAQCTKRLPLPGLSNGKEDTAEGAIVDCVVCCLSLMGSDWLGMIKEARRVMKMGGKLKIAEVTSRFTDVKDFIQLINAIGFKLSSKDESNTHFILFDFEKIPLQNCKSGMLNLSDADRITLSQDLLKPCIYKRR